MTAVERTESFPSPRRLSEFETVIRSRHDDVLAKLFAVNTRLGELKDQSGPRATELRCLLAFYDDMLILIDRHGASLFGEADPSTESEVVG